MNRLEIIISLVDTVQFEYFIGRKSVVENIYCVFCRYFCRKNRFILPEVEEILLQSLELYVTPLKNSYRAES